MSILVRFPIQSMTAEGCVSTAHLIGRAAGLAYARQAQAPVMGRICRYARTTTVCLPTRALRSAWAVI